MDRIPGESEPTSRRPSGAGEPLQGSQSFSGDTTTKLLVDLVSQAAGLAAGIATARWLGPEGKGLYAALTYVVYLSVALATSGLGESAIVAVGHGRVRLQTAVSSSVSAVAMLSTVAGLLAGIGATLLPGAPRALDLALVAAVAVPIMAGVQLVTGVLNAAHEIRRSSVAALVTSVATAVLVIVFLAVLGGDVVEAMIATVLGSAAGLITLWVMARRATRVRFVPGWNGDYVRWALRFGVASQFAQLLTVLAGRLDLLVVLYLMGAEAAGLYSVALTIGLTALTAPAALVYAAFPRFAALTDHDAWELLATLTRVAALSTLAFGTIIVLAVPFIVPLAFGVEYTPAALPAVVLTVGGVLTSIQWVAARGLAARGRPAVMVRAFAITVIVMLGLDALLIPAWGILGAATASAISPIAGIWICRRSLLRISPRPAWEWLPRLSDVQALTAYVSALAARARRINRAQRDGE